MPDNFRLDVGVRPHAYRLRLAPDLDASRFEGAVEIDVDLDGARDEVTLHALELELFDAAAVLDGGRRLDAATAMVPDDECATLAFREPIGPGRVTLSLGFRGALNERLAGLYGAALSDGEGGTHPIAVTQFAPTDARRAFPCFDEPAMKATFEVTAVVAPGLGAYSNSPVAAETTLPDGRREVAFSRTMAMSTYLVALVVGPFAQSEVVDVDGIPLSVVCAPGKEHLSAFALEAGAFALRFFTEYFDLPYPGDKVDLVAIPDFAYGAMENLGCVTFREMALLIDPASATTPQLQSVAMVVAHELAHMWFGDLVTMQWWEGIWLNEAFATFMQYLCTDAFRPQWQLWIQFNTAREQGLAVDGLHSTRAIEFVVRSPADAMAMFDAITYLKGGSVLRMLEQYLTADVFRDGIRRYLTEHAHANTVTADLWGALEAASGAPVSSIMDTWILQGGHPTVHVAGGTITQSPFSYLERTGPSAIGTTWRVPVRARPLRGGAPAAQLLDAEPATLEVAAPAVVNAGGAGAYRTSYEPDALRALADDLEALTEIERAVLLGDTRALARAGVRSAGDVLMLARRLGTVIEPTGWQVVADHLADLDRLVTDEERPGLVRTVASLFGPLHDELGWSPRDGEDERTPLVRALAVRALGTLGGDDAIRAAAAAQFDGGEVEGELADAVLAVVASMARPGDDEELRRRCGTAATPQAEERYRTALARIPDARVAVTTFEHCFEWFKLQDVPRLVLQLLMNPVGGHDVWEALSARWEDTVARVSPLLQSALGSGVSSFVEDRAFAERVAAFHRAHPLAVGQQRIEQALEFMFVGVAAAERTRPALAAMLA